MMMPMPQLVSGAESLAMGRRIRTDIHDSVIFMAYDLRLAAGKASVFDIDADAMGDRLQFDIYWI